MKLLYVDPKDIDTLNDTFRFSLTSFNDTEQIDRLHDAGSIDIPVYGFKYQSRITLLQGFRLLEQALREKSATIPLLMIDFSGENLQDAWRWVIHQISNRMYSEIELIYGLCKMYPFFSHDKNLFTRLSQRILPGYDIEDYLQIGHFPRPFLKRLHIKKVSLKKAKCFLPFNNIIRRRLFVLCILFSQTSVSHLRNITEFLLDMAKAQNKQIIEILKNNSIKQIFNNKYYSRKQKARLFFDYLYQKRYPMMASTKSKFNEKIKNLISDEPIRISPPSNFEGHHVEMTVRLDKNFSVVPLQSYLLKKKRELEELVLFINELE